MKYYIIAGEASGDLHASNMIKELKKLDPNADFRCWGGDLMEAEGATLVKHYRDLAFMGFVEVLMNLRTILGNMKFCKKDIAEYQPDALILVDYPGFNLRIADWAKKEGIPVHYYISPQIWAWKQSRIHQIKRNVDHMYVILPFEKPFYEQFDYPVEFVGHPLLDAIEQFKAKQDPEGFRSKHQLDPDKPIISLLPGSRKQEIKTMLPLMLSVQKHFPEFQWVIAGAPSQTESFYAPFTTNTPDVHLVMNDTYGLLQESKAALVTSGTATLETALFGVPEVVCYKGSFISYLIARRLIKVKYISLVNLIMDRELVKELIQNELTEMSIKEELNALLHNDVRKQEIEQGYAQLKKKLGGGGASIETASTLLKTLK